MKYRSRPKGFTIIELLVVIAIMAALSSVIFAVGKRMIIKGRQATMISNMKQFSAFFTAYATDHQEQLLPCRGEVVQGDGSIDSDALWHEIILSMLYENTEPIRFKQEDWWNSNESFIRNPLFQKTDSPRGWQPLNPGYGYNIMLAENYHRQESSSIPGQDELERTLVPMAFLSESSMIPIVAPCDDYYYRYDAAQISQFDSTTLKKFLLEDKFPVLFLDGHVETLRPGEYVDRQLDRMPLEPNP